MKTEKIILSLNIVFYLALISTYVVAYVIDKEIRKTNNAYDIDYIEGLSITVFVCHIVGGILYFVYRYYKPHPVITYFIFILLTLSFVLNLKLMEVPYDTIGIKTLQLDWLDTYYPVVWRLSSLILALFYFPLLSINMKVMERIS